MTHFTTLTTGVWRTQDGNYILCFKDHLGQDRSVIQGTKSIYNCGVEDINIRGLLPTTDCFKVRVTLMCISDELTEKIEPGDFIVCEKVK